MSDLKAIAWRQWSKKCRAFYVESLPGDGGKDWGYTEDHTKAVPLNVYWQRRFAADCRRVRSEARFFPVCDSQTAYGEAA